MADLRTVLRIIARDETKGALTKTQKELKSIGTTLGDLRNQALALAGINFGIGGLAQLTALADGYQLTTSRLKLLSGETENFAALQKDVFNIAQETFTTYEQTSALYGNLAASTKEVGVTQKDLLTITEALNQSYQISGSTQQEAAASTIQLVQALASGQIRGQEFNSVAEQGRRILFALKDATGRTAGELRQFANEGKLTTEFFLKAFLPQAEKIDEEFQTLPLTVGRSLTQLQNAFEQYVGQQNQSLGITRDVAEVFQELAFNFESFANTVVVSGAAVVAFLSGKFAQSLSGSIAKKLADVQATVATVRANEAQSIALRKVATDEFRTAAATEARLASQLAADRATLASARLLGVSGGQRVALERTINAVNIEHIAAVNARIAADARLVATNNAVTASAAKTAFAMRALNGTVAFFGGPVGAAITALIGLGAAIAYVDSQTTTGSEAYDEFKKSLENTDKETKPAAEGIESVATAMERLNNATEFADIRKGREAIKLLAKEIEDTEKKLNQFDPRARASTALAPRLEGLKRKLADAQKILEEREATLQEMLDKQRGISNELDKGVPKTLSDAIEQQKDANTDLQNIEKQRRKIIEELDKLSAELTGPKVDVKEQTDAFNVLALNTLRGQIQGDISAGDAEGAIRNLDKAKQIIEQLQKTGGASDSYLKTQVDLLKELTKDAGGIELEVEPKVDDAAVLDEARNIQSVYNSVRDQFPWLPKVDVDENALQGEVLKGIAAAQQTANENPIAIRWATPEDAAAVPAQANAAGGYIRGPGSGTSDSILSWLSNGEFVVRAAAVQHYGADLLKRLNSMTLPRFASGGPVRVPAASAPAASGAPIIFNLNGQQYEATISGGGAGDLRNALKRENMRRGTRA